VEQIKERHVFLYCVESTESITFCQTCIHPNSSKLQQRQGPVVASPSSSLFSSRSDMLAMLSLRLTWRSRNAALDTCVYLDSRQGRKKLSLVLRCVMVRQYVRTNVLSFCFTSLIKMRSGLGSPPSYVFCLQPSHQPSLEQIPRV